METRQIIKRYKNRKLYHMQQSCYVALRDIARILKEGNDVLVIDDQTGEDLTQMVLAQVLYRASKEANAIKNLHQTVLELDKCVKELEACQKKSWSSEKERQDAKV